MGTHSKAMVWVKPNYESFFDRHVDTFRRIVQLCDPAYAGHLCFSVRRRYLAVGTTELDEASDGPALNISLQQ